MLPIRLSTWASLSICLVEILRTAICSSLPSVPPPFPTPSYHFTNTWAVEVVGGEAVAKALAAKYGFTYRGHIIEDYYSFQHRRVARRSISYQSVPSKRNLAQEPKVLWVCQQVAKKRVKRRAPSFIDPKWMKMWYLNRGGGRDMNVEAAWLKGFTGKGVVVTILDDGIEKDHPDLRSNYDPQASYDVNNMDHDPQPRYDWTNENKHGTRCAGEVAATANNSFCALGVAYGASIGGVRMLDGDVTDAVEARSLSYANQHVDIYSASWGPDDDGKTVDGPGVLARKAFATGTRHGRGGKGAVFVWASGNGGRKADSCNCDGYTNSIYTVSVSSATETGEVPWYSEACSSTLAATYSSGGRNEGQIVTTDLRHTCTVEHTGTSASAPIAAGVIAIALQANGSLSWRDVQHIIVLSARRANLQTSDWQRNGAGHEVSHQFGFGLMDAHRMVQHALSWKAVGPQQVCEHAYGEHITGGGLYISPFRSRIFRLNTTACFGHRTQHVRFLEHVQARLEINSGYRGNLRINLTSPSGTVSKLLQGRRWDDSAAGFSSWSFMTTHNWGEPAAGEWILEIENHGKYVGTSLKAWTLVLYGTYDPPFWLASVNSTTRNGTMWKPRRNADDIDHGYLDDMGPLFEPTNRSPPLIGGHPNRLLASLLALIAFVSCHASASRVQDLLLTASKLIHKLFLFGFGVVHLHLLILIDNTAAILLQAVRSLFLSCHLSQRFTASQFLSPLASFALALPSAERPQKTWLVMVPLCNPSPSLDCAPL